MQSKRDVSGPWRSQTGGYRLGPARRRRWAGPILELIDRHRISAVSGVAPQIALMLQVPDLDRFDFDCVHAVVAGGSASPPALVAEARRVFGAPYSIRYSSTESGGVGLGTALDADDGKAEGNAPIMHGPVMQPAQFTMKILHGA